MKQIEVQIMGQSYLLGCPDGGEERLREAVEKVDGAMCRIRDAGKVKARDRIAVLAALNLAFDLTERVPWSPRPTRRRTAARDGPRTTPRPRHGSPTWCNAWTRRWAATANCCEPAPARRQLSRQPGCQTILLLAASRPGGMPLRRLRNAYNGNRLQCMPGFIFP